MPFTLSPNMNLQIPGVATQPGPQYANNVNASLTIVDSHNHSPGSGVQITPAGLNINTDLTLNTNSLTNINSLALTVLSSPLSTSLLNRIYDVNGNLYFNDGSGNQIAITASGAVAGTPGSIANLVSPASASYVSLNSTFVFQSNTNTAANLDGASLNLRNLTSGSPALTLSPPILSSNYTLVLPTLPSVQSFMTLDSSGNITAPWTLDNSSLVLSGSHITINAQGVQQSMLASKPPVVAPSGVVPVGSVAVSASFGSLTTTNTSFTTISASVMTLACTGNRPVRLVLQPDGSGTYSTEGAMELRYAYNGTVIAVFENVLPTSPPVLISPSFEFLFFPGAGNNTFNIDWRATTGGTQLNNCRFVVYEI